MKKLLQYTALLLAVVWLPATLHCALETAGIFEMHGGEHGAVAMACCGGVSSPEKHQCSTHTHDACHMVESSPWLNTANAVKTPPPTVALLPTIDPAATMFVMLAFTQSLQHATATPNDYTREHPQNWIPARHFTERAAPVSRAPAICLA